MNKGRREGQGERANNNKEFSYVFVWCLFRSLIGPKSGQNPKKKKHPNLQPHFLTKIFSVFLFCLSFLSFLFCLFFSVFSFLSFLFCLFFSVFSFLTKSFFGFLSCVVLACFFFVVLKKWQTNRRFLARFDLGFFVLLGFFLLTLFLLDRRMVGMQRSVCENVGTKKRTEKA